MKKNVKRRFITITFILAMGVLPMANAYINTYASVGYVASGPGVALSNKEDTKESSEYTADSGVSLDADAYAETGGVAQGGLVIDQTVPEGYTSVGEIETIFEDAIVATEDMYTYDIMVSDINELKQRYGSRLKVGTIGTSADGRSLYELIVGNEDAATHILITASMHGREYITSNLCMKQLEYLLYTYDIASFDGETMATWMDRVCMHFVPMVDPDGVSISQFGLDGLSSSSLKAIVEQAYQDDTEAGYTSLDFETYLTRWKANARGVNLNQNFDALFELATGTATSPSSDSYKGPYPESEPESKALADLYRSRTWRAVLNYHAQGQVLYWDIENNKMREHSRDLSNQISLLTGYTKAVAGGGGGFKEFVQLNEDPAACVTIEVGLGVCPLPSSQLEEIWTQNRLVPHYTMKWAYDKFEG